MPLSSLVACNPSMHTDGERRKEQEHISKQSQCGSVKFSFSLMLTLSSKSALYRIFLKYWPSHNTQWLVLILFIAIIVLAQFDSAFNINLQLVWNPVATCQMPHSLFSLFHSLTACSSTFLTGCVYIKNMFLDSNTFFFCEVVLWVDWTLII